MLQACVANPVKITAKHANLDSEEKQIVDGFIELVHGIVGSHGNIDEISDMLTSIRRRIESKIQTHGAAYMEKLANTLTNIDIPADSVQSIISSISRMVDDDAGANVKTTHRAKRSPTYGKKGKWKKGKKGYKKKKC